jgi:hypothetical protein
MLPEFKTNDMATVVFKEWACDVQLRTYRNDRIAIELIDLTDGGPVATASCNLPDEPCEPGHTFIKDWSENEGMTDALIAAGIVQLIKRVQVNERVSAAYVKVLIV